MDVPTPRETSVSFGCLGIVIRSKQSHVISNDIKHDVHMSAGLLGAHLSLWRLPVSRVRGGLEGWMRTIPVQASKYNTAPTAYHLASDLMSAPESWAEPCRAQRFSAVRRVGSDRFHSYFPTIRAKDSVEDMSRMCFFFCIIKSTREQFFHSFFLKFDECSNE